LHDENGRASVPPTTARKRGSMLRSTRFIPDWPTVLATSALSITVALIHVLDQGGITKYAGSPWWLGGGYRAVEVAGVVTAVALVTLRRWIPPWIAAFLVGFGPFAAYLLTRIVGLPGDPGDYHNWGDPLGTASLFVEGTLMLLAASMVIRLRHVDPDVAPNTVLLADRHSDTDLWTPAPQSTL
jgi:hypothetical protein